ncbi:helix-turn-helix domain-containing protein [Tenacibaculum agarivorans]|uniref:helix-turn-helix domain-containing protein n=1 Tax=Tenacibaculum agarivorans TaxID=1908389 RepID=UPI0013566C8C|nr:helix-turn-helix domain-containing protein [Tenacibaculum agarivorans]
MKNITKEDRKYLNLLQKVKKFNSTDSKAKYLDSVGKIARQEKAYRYLFVSYNYLGLLYNDERVLLYSDSIIKLSSKIHFEDEFYPKDAYQTKGDFFFKKKDYKRALKNYLKVSEYAKKYKNDYLTYSNNRNIAFIKRITGNYEIAIKLQKQNLNYLMNRDKLDTTSYLNTLVSLANVFNDAHISDSAFYYNKLGIRESLKFKKNKYYNHFSINNGITLYLKGEYKKAIDTINKYSTYFEKFKSKKNLSFAYYYCGKAYLKINDKPKAINYFKKTDTIFIKYGNLYPFMRKNYVHLVDYYKEKKDLNNHLIYLNKLIKFDSLLHSQDIYLNKELIEKYDIPKLRQEKKVILNTMKNKDKISFSIIFSISSILILISILLLYQIKLKINYKKRFNSIIDEKKKEKKIKHEETINNLNVPKKIVEEILISLESFEKSTKYTNKDLTLVSLSKEYSTNTNYLSKVINHYKKKNFSNYLNELRIEYAIEKMKNDLIFRKYTIKAIAEEVGFKSSESFSKAFYKLKGIKPSYFLKELIKSKKDDY